MKIFAIMLTLAGLLATSAMADEPTGISGTVVDMHGTPMANAQIRFYKAPYVENNTRIITLRTDKRGFFSTLGLEPGRYVLMADVPNLTMGCAVEDAIGGESARIKIQVGYDKIMCSGPRVHPALIDPNATASVYRI